LGSLVWNSGVVSATTEIQVPTGELEVDTTYQWHVRYQCESVVEGVGKWSEWSAFTWFLTKGASGEEDGDFNIDHIVDPLDLLMILNHWHGNGVGDMTGNGYIDWQDVMKFSARWDGQ